VNAFCFHRCMRMFSKRQSVVFAAAAAIVALLGFSAATSSAAPYVLTDNNSSLAVSPSSMTGPGLWDVDGVNQLGEEWFWYRIGNSAGQTDLASLPSESEQLYDSNGDGNDDTAEFTYGSPTGLQIVLMYSLVGGQSGSGTSDLGELVEFSNNGTSAQTYHFFEYTNFNLDASTAGQTVSVTGGNTATVLGNGFEAQTVVSPMPSEYEASNTTASPDLLDDISSSSTSYTLTDVASASSGDPEWAFEWDFTLNAGGSYLISIDKNIRPYGTTPPVPEPAGGVLTLLGCVGLISMRPRRRKWVTKS
jgi:hypothetical protein